MAVQVLFVLSLVGGVTGAVVHTTYMSMVAMGLYGTLHASWAYRNRSRQLHENCSTIGGKGAGEKKEFLKALVRTPSLLPVPSLTIDECAASAHNLDITIYASLCLAYPYRL